MAWVIERWKEPSTKNALATIFALASAYAPPHYQMLIQGVAVALGLRAATQPG